MSVTDHFGRFTLRGIAPGEYTLFAFEDIDPDVYFDPDFLRPFEAKATRVTIAEGSRETVSLRLIPAEGSR